MQTINIKSVIVIAVTLLLTAVFCTISFAAISETDSKGSYSYSESKKGEGNGSKAYPHKSPRDYRHGKKEGSGSKTYAPSRHGYTHKGKEGSRSKRYFHGSAHGKSYSSHKGFDHGSAHQPGKSSFEHVLCFQKKLGLTKEQIDKIKAHEFEFKKMEIQTKADHAIAHMELDRLVHSETVDEAGMRTLADRISEIKSRKIHAMVEAKIAILKILTAEQRQKANKMHSSH